MDNETLAKTILASLSTLEKIEDVLNKLIPDLIEIDEKIAAIEALPKVLHVDEDIKWRSRLTSKMRQLATDYEMQIKDSRLRDLEPNLEYLCRIRPEATLSLSFPADLDVVIRYYQHALLVALEDPLHRKTKLRERNFEENCCLERLKADIKLYVMSRYPSYLSQEEEYVRHRRNLGGGRERHRTNNSRGCEDGDHDDEPTKVVRDIFNEGFMHWNNERRGSEKRLDFYFETTNTWNPLAGMRPQIQPYSSDFVKRLLFNKHIAFIGDSLTRAIYKDLVRLLQNDLLLTPAQLKSKSEISHLGDRQIDSLPLDADKIFRQAREYCTNYHLLQYLFTTRAMKDDVEKFILTFQKHGEFPDVLVINSALWDLTRYYDHDTDMSRVAPYEDNPRSQLEDETNSMDEYIERISILMRRLRVILPAHTQVIWLLMPWPLSVGNSALLNKNTGQRKLHRSIYLDGNYRAAQVVSNAGYDVLDISFYMRDHSLYPLRVNDGVHWGTVGTRLMTQLLVGHLAKNITLPMDIEQNLKQCHNMCTQQGTARGDNFPKENFEYYALTNRNGRAGKDSASGSATKFDGEGAYFNFLQRQLAAKTYENMSPQVKDVISQDIQLYRMSEIIRKRKLRLEPEEELALIERTKGAPKVKDLMVGGTYEEQVIKVVHRPNQR